MTNNKHGPPGWMHLPNKGAPPGPAPGTGGQKINVITGCFDQNEGAMQIRKRKRREEFLLSELCG